MQDNFSIPFINANLRPAKGRGKFKGGKTYPRHALFATLAYLHPKKCLEIGTYYAYSARITSLYFKWLEPDGLIVTCDIQRYVNITNKHIKQLIVKAHVPRKELKKWHDLDNRQNVKYSKNSVKENIEIIKKAAGKNFDFAYIDGDHTKTSFLNDLKIAKALLKPPRYMLLDDTKDGLHECKKAYEEIRHNYNHYDFEDWGVPASSSLIWEK